MRIIDWSSDVCSSDLSPGLCAVMARPLARRGGGGKRPRPLSGRERGLELVDEVGSLPREGVALGGAAQMAIGGGLPLDRIVLAEGGQICIAGWGERGGTFAYSSGVTVPLKNKK